MGTEASKRPDVHVDITACTSSELLNRSTTIRDVEVILDPKIVRKIVRTALTRICDAAEREAREARG